MHTPTAFPQFTGYGTYFFWPLPFSPAILMCFLRTPSFLLSTRMPNHEPIAAASAFGALSHFLASYCLALDSDFCHYFSNVFLRCVFFFVLFFPSPTPAFQYRIFSISRSFISSALNSWAFSVQDRKVLLPRPKPSFLTFLVLGSMSWKQQVLYRFRLPTFTSIIAKWIQASRSRHILNLPKTLCDSKTSFIEY